jgi:Protein of unknown function (DUF4230)
MARTDDTSSDPNTTMPRMPGMPTPGRQSGEQFRTAELPEVAQRVIDRESDDTDRPAPPPDSPYGFGGRLMRGLFWLVATMGLVVALVLGAQGLGLIPHFGNPFQPKTTDRTGPVLLKSIQDLSRFVAAEGNFEVIVDVQNNRKYVPDFLLNDRVLFVAAGSVEAYVDFATIGQGAITESADKKTVEIRLPAPALGKPNIDNDRSRVFAQQKGLFNKIGDLFSGDPNRLQQVYQLAEEKIANAAKDSGLLERAQENTRKMLDSMLRSLGYTTITVVFAAP